MRGYSESTCKFCGHRILWSICDRWIDEDGDWHNFGLPINPSGAVHGCRERAEWEAQRQAQAPRPLALAQVVGI